MSFRDDEFTLQHIFSYYIKILKLFFCDARTGCSTVGFILNVVWIRWFVYYGFCSVSDVYRGTHMYISPLLCALNCNLRIFGQSLLLFEDVFTVHIFFQLSVTTYISCLSKSVVKCNFFTQVFEIGKIYKFLNTSYTNSKL